MDRDLRTFRQKAEEQGLGGRGRRYPAELRDLAVAYWRRRAPHGERRVAVARELGISEKSLLRWEAKLEPASAASSQLREVVVVGEPEVGPRPNLSLVTPSGYRVEGLTLDDVGVLLGALP